jgi:hypothetical protein
MSVAFHRSLFILSSKRGPCFRFGMSFQEPEVFYQLVYTKTLMSKTGMSFYLSDMLLRYIKMELVLIPLSGCVATAISGVTH